jgi:hypothetical protein
MQNTTLIICATFLLLGCKDAGVNPEQRLFARTDKNTYVIGESIVFKIEAGPYSSAYFWHCNNRIAYAIEKKQPDQQWPPPGTIGLICLAIYPQGIVELTPNNVIQQSAASWSQTGTYRLRFIFGWDRNDISKESIVSNEFVVQ